MSQSKMQSLRETMTNLLIGGVISWVIVYSCMKYIPDNELSATVSVILCTVASLVRGYTVRRHYNRKTS